jgi:ferredoxin
MTEHAGGISWWTLGSATDPDKLLANFEALGLPKYAPEQRSWLMSLKAALADMFPGHMVRPLKNRDKNGYTVVAEVKGEDENDFPAVASATITAEGEIVVRSGEIDAVKLQELANHFKRVLPASSVSAVMVEIVNIVLGGLSMRDGGGIYFMPEDKLSKWKSVGMAVESAACDGSKNCVTVCPMETNEMTLRDIRDAIVREVETESAAIRKELVDNDFGVRAIENRVSRSGDLIARMQQYEKLLGETLGSCREALKPTLQALQAAKAEQDSVQTFGDMYDIEEASVA